MRPPPAYAGTLVQVRPAHWRRKPRTRPPALPGPAVPMPGAGSLTRQSL